MVFNTSIGFSEVSTFPNRDGCDIGYYDAYWERNQIAGGSKTWNSFLLERKMNYESNILLKASLLYSGAVCTNCPDTMAYEKSYECSNTTALAIFFSGLSLQTKTSMHCEDHKWVTDTCSDQLSFCVDCVSPCDCESKDSMFPSRGVCHSGGGKASSLCLSVFSLSNPPPFEILNVTSSSEIAMVWVAMKGEGYLYCAALEASYDVKSVEVIRTKGFGRTSPP